MSPNLKFLGSLMPQNLPKVASYGNVPPGRKLYDHGIAMRHFLELDVFSKYEPSLN